MTTCHFGQIMSHVTLPADAVVAHVVECVAHHANDGAQPLIESFARGAISYGDFIMQYLALRRLAQPTSERQEVRGRAPSTSITLLTDYEQFHAELLDETALWSLVNLPSELPRSFLYLLLPYMLYLAQLVLAAGSAGALIPKVRQLVQRLANRLQPHLQPTEWTSTGVRVSGRLRDLEVARPPAPTDLSVALTVNQDIMYQQLQRLRAPDALILPLVGLEWARGAEFEWAYELLCFALSCE